MHASQLYLYLLQLISRQQHLGLLQQKHEVTLIIIFPLFVFTRTGVLRVGSRRTATAA
jgi:hypothetical protein